MGWRNGTPRRDKARVRMRPRKNRGETPRPPVEALIRTMLGNFHLQESLSPWLDLTEGGRLF